MVGELVKLIISAILHPQLRSDLIFYLMKRDGRHCLDLSIQNLTSKAIDFIAV